MKQNRLIKAHICGILFQINSYGDNKVMKKAYIRSLFTSIYMKNSEILHDEFQKVDINFKAVCDERILRALCDFYRNISQYAIETYDFNFSQFFSDFKGIDVCKLIFERNPSFIVLLLERRLNFSMEHVAQLLLDLTGYIAGQTAIELIIQKYEDNWNAICTFVEHVLTIFYKERVKNLVIDK